MPKLKTKRPGNGCLLQPGTAVIIYQLVFAGLHSLCYL